MDRTFNPCPLLSLVQLILKNNAMILIQSEKNHTSYKAPDILNIRKKIIVSNTNGYHFIDQNTILYLKSEGNCCNIYLTDGTRIFCSKTLKSIFNDLDKSQFIRSHKSFVFNWKMVKHINASLNQVRLQGGIIVPIARARKKELKWKLS